ncbi:hypothetical protein RKLH11_198 [Rhodobacteraceae bacterium KLH11]|nr:hypothetical protein RKLH11_198 [Rhodobacteraceae bacterium KLH11]
MSFDPKSKAHKAKLYKALVAAAELENEPFDQFLQTPFSPPWSLADNYRRNLQRGEYSAIRAKVLHEFLLNRHFSVAHLEAPEIFPQTPEMRWREILDARATSDRLRIVIAKSQFGIVERESQLEVADTTLKLGQPFLLELTSDIDGHAVALQGVRGQWHPIPLGQDGALSAPVVAGKNLLPGHPDGRPDPLIEGHDEGLHEFVLITAQKTVVPVEAKRLAIWVADNPCSLFRISVQFVK